MPGHHGVQVPDFIEPVLGWKVLRWDPHGPLVSLQSGRRWPVGAPLVAHCDTERFGTDGHRVDRRHTSPADGCACGIWAADTPFPLGDFWTRVEHPVAALVSGWGKVIAHEHGWRAQYAYPRVLFIVGKAGCRDSERIQADLTRHGVPVGFVDTELTSLGLESWYRRAGRLVSRVLKR